MALLAFLVVISAFAVIVAGQHAPGSGKQIEHDALMALVSPSSNSSYPVSHTAIADGSWFSQSTWDSQYGIPGAGANVYVPSGRTVLYDGVSTAAIRTVFVEGTMEWSTTTNTALVVDTFVNGAAGTVQIGTVAEPVSSGVSCDIKFTQGPINVTWDPLLQSRGFISHGILRIHGAVKTPHLKVANDPLAGNTTLLLASTPVNWAVGDKLVIAGTIYDGYKWNNTARRTDPYPPEDEVVTITAVSGATVTFSPALVHNHASPRADLKTSVGLLTRNVHFRSEPNAPVAERGHVMFMHNKDVDVRYAEFERLGRTDKSVRAKDVGRLSSINSTANVKGRYSFHFHRNGVPSMPDQRNPAVAIGNSAYHSPGWCFVHHDSHALFDSNVAYDCFGAGFSAETGNEVGSWTRNLAIYSKGIQWGDPKNAVDLDDFDTGNSGDCFWFQSRMVRTAENIAASCNNAYSYFHRGALNSGDGASQLSYSAASFQLPDALALRAVVAPDDAPIRQFVDNEAFASRTGLHVVKANPGQGHDVHSHLKRLVAWNVRECASITYTAHYILEEFDCIGRPAGVYTGAKHGIELANNAGDIIVLRPKIHSFPLGIRINPPDSVNLDRNFVIVNPQFSSVAEEYQGLNLTHDTLLTAYTIDPRLSVSFDYSLLYKEGGNPSLDQTIRKVNITGTKTDSLGLLSIPPVGDAGPDNYNAIFSEVVTRLATAGYYTDIMSGERIFVLPDFYTDRGTGEVHMLGSWVRIDPSVVTLLGNQYFSYAAAVDRGNLTTPDAPPVVQGEYVITPVETDVTINLLANDADPSGDLLSVAAILQPDRAEVFDNGDGTVLFRPDLGFAGTVNFFYWVTDGHANFAKGAVLVDVVTGTGTSSASSGSAGTGTAGQPEDNVVDGGKTLAVSFALSISVLIFSVAM